MIIAFICGSLEQGKDGVGDYTRRLAGELVRQGHTVAIMALYDHYIGEAAEGAQMGESVALPVLRIPVSAAVRRRTAVAKAWVDKLNPDWLSLQFVPFAFHAKGLPFSLASILWRIGRGRNWHIMFHELWVGVRESGSAKLISWGWVQKQIIRSMVSSLTPSIVHTQSLLYQAQLGRIGIFASYLPLFGNIPISKANCAPLIPEQSKRLILVSFGTIRKGVPIEKFAAEVACYSLRHKVEVLLKIVGRSGTEQARWLKIWQASGLNVEILGEQSPFQISEIFHSAILGISTTPLVLAEKSGSVASMLEHGLPVLCVRQPFSGEDVFSHTLLAGVLQYIPGNFEECICKTGKSQVESMLGKVGRKLVEDLQACHKG